MKFFSKIQTASIAIVLVFSFLIFVHSCNNPSTTTTSTTTTSQDSLTAKSDINPNFEMAPPVAGDIVIQQLKDNKEGNILFVADFGKKLGTQRTHTVRLGDQQIILHDDGKGGDEKEGDGRFSVILRQDVNELQRQIEISVKQLREQKEFITFNGRTMVHNSVEKLNLDDFKTFIDGRPFRIPVFPLICSAPVNVLKDHSLTVTAASVVEDPTRTFNPCNNTGNANGVWAFGRLITEMCNMPLTGIQPKDFFRKWLETWVTDQNVNSDIIKKRLQISQIINTWNTLSHGTFDIRFAPFKLIAIVNRVDLRGNSGYGFKNPGEGRFVFTAINCAGASPRVFRNPQPFMIILEYGLPKKSCSDLKAFAKQWADLSGMPFGAAYNTALQTITNQFTLANTSPSKPNGSSLNQLRTNEFALGTLPWELREFNIDAATHLLKNVTVKQEPQIRFNNLHPSHVAGDVQTMANFVNTHTADVEATKYTVPEIEGGKNFLAGHAETLNPVNYHWDGTSAATPPQFIISDSARFVFSLNTCSGCHGGEAFTGNFMHVAPGGLTGVPAILSSFLKGNPPMSAGPFLIPDRANRPPGRIREFNDLERRKIDLQNFVHCLCGRSLVFELVNVLRFEPLRMTH